MTISNQIIEVFNYLGEKFGLAIDWSSENVLPYLTDLCNRVVKQETYTSIAWIVIWIIVIIAAICLIIFLYKLDDDIAFTFSFPVVILVAIGIIAIGIQIFDLIECATIPETIILDKMRTITNLMK